MRFIWEKRRRREAVKGLIETKGRTDGCKTADEKVIGTYFHGIFHNDEFRGELLNQIRQIQRACRRFIIVFHLTNCVKKRLIV